MESLVQKAATEGDEATRALDAALLQHLPHAALSTMAHGERLSVAHLRCATRHLCDAVLTSAWLDTHPTRSELIAHVFKKRLEPPSSANGIIKSPSDVSLSELFMSEIHTRRSLQATTKLTNSIRHGMKRARVQVSSAVFEIPSLKSYTLQRRTQHLQSLARTLQENMCAARSLVAVGDTTYNDLLANVKTQLAEAQQDVVEVVVWSVVLDWPSPTVASAVQADMSQIFDRWTEKQSMQTLLSLAPWPATMLARVSSVFARHYVSGVMQIGSHTLGKEQVRYRIGALVLQGSDLQTIVETQLNSLDRLIREQLLTDLTI